LFPNIGTVTCTLGEIKHRADLVVILGARSGLENSPLSRLCGRGENCQTIHVEAQTDDFAALWLLRALIQGKPVDPALGPVAGMPLADWRNLAERLKNCKFGVLFLDSTSNRATEAAHGLATDLNAFTRFYVLSLPRPGNRVGAEQVLTWQTGYPAAVGLHSGYPRSYGSEFSAERLLARGEADSVLLVGPGDLGGLSPSASDRLNHIPVIALSPQITDLPAPAAVAITTAACANPRGGTAFRFDGLALPLRSATSYSFPDDFQVLQRIEQALRRAAALH
jgi:formylmethanofuran dehydrogenase subunit B